MHINPIHIIIGVGTGCVAGYFYRNKGKANLLPVVAICAAMVVLVLVIDWVTL